MSAAEKSIPGSWPRGQWRLTAYYRAQPIYRAPVSDRDLFEGAPPPPVLLRAMGTTLVAGSTSKGGSFGGGNVPCDCTQEKGEPLLKADSGPEDVPPDLYRCLNGTERGLINGQANNEGTMNDQEERGGRGGRRERSDAS